MTRFVRPTLKCSCFQFQIRLKTGIVSSESGESSWRKFGLRQAALWYCALWGGRRQRIRLLVYWLLPLKSPKSIGDLSHYHLCHLCVWPCVFITLSSLPPVCLAHVFVTLSSLPALLFGPIYLLSLYHLCKLCVWPFVFLTLSSLPTVVFGPTYLLSLYHLRQLW